MIAEDHIARTALLILLLLAGVILIVDGQAACPTGCECLSSGTALKYGYALCGGKQTICGYDAYQNPLYCYQKPVTTTATTPPQAACPTGCDCLSSDTGAKYGYALCGGKQTICGYDAYQNPFYCYQKPVTTTMAPTCRYDSSTGVCTGSCGQGLTCHLNSISRDPATGKVISAECTCKAAAGDEKTPPVIDLVVSPLSPSEGEPVTVAVAASDLNGITGIVISIDGQKVKECQGTTACTYTSSALPPGDRRITATATDGFGNVGIQPWSTVVTSRPAGLCARVQGSVQGFAYSLGTLKIKAERLEETTPTLGGIPRSMEIVVETRTFNVTSPREFEIAYTTDCLGTGRWRIMPIYAESEGACRWQGSWSPGNYVVSTDESPVGRSDADFRFTPTETSPPTGEIRYRPEQPSSGDRVTVSVTASDPSGIARIAISEYGLRVGGIPEVWRQVRACEGAATCSYTGGPFPSLTLLQHSVDICDGAGNKRTLYGSVAIGNCSDGIQNRDETGVDCGGASCLPCNICSMADLPSRFDWRAWNGRNWVSPIKDQAACGSCWAFSTAGVTETKYNIEQNLVANIDLSEQNLVSSCYPEADCRGRSASVSARLHTLGFMKDTGIVEETCFPYQSQQCLFYDPAIDGNRCCDASAAASVGCTVCTCGGSCSRPCGCDRCTDWTSRLWKISGYDHIGGDRNVIKRAILCRGPLQSCGGGHCIVIIGWNDDTGSWIIKNSWGIGWGNGGFGEVPYNTSWCSDTYSVNGVRRG